MVVTGWEYEEQAQIKFESQASIRQKYRHRLAKIADKERKRREIRERNAWLWQEPETPQQALLQEIYFARMVWNCLVKTVGYKRLKHMAREVSAI